MSPMFDRHFSLAEATELIPFITTLFEKVHWEMGEIKDEIILYQRLQNIQEKEGVYPDNNLNAKAVSQVLRRKFKQYDIISKRYENLLLNRGLHVRSMERGIIDFPYMAPNGKEYFLCWHFGEEDLYYFHEIYKDMAERQPITMLPQ